MHKCSVCGVCNACHAAALTALPEPPAFEPLPQALRTAPPDAMASLLLLPGCASVDIDATLRETDTGRVGPGPGIQINPNVSPADRLPRRAPHVTALQTPRGFVKGPSRCF